MNTKFIIIPVIFLLFSSLVLATPGIPHQFYGSVTLNGSPAPDGTTVTAKINGVQVASTTTVSGKYGYEPIFYVDDPDSDRTGDEIVFFVNNVNTGQKAFFANGGRTRLDLTATGTTSNPPSGGGGGGGTSGGGTTTGGTTGGTTFGTTQQGCQERWLCQDWSECKDGIQTRTCADQNNCGTNNNEPFTSQPCSAEEAQQQTQAQMPLFPTGFFLGLSNEWAIAIIVAIVVAAAIISFLLLRKKSVVHQ